MSVFSLPFVLLCALTLLLYWKLPRRGQHILLLVASVLFLASQSLPTLVHAAATVLITTLAVHAIVTYGERKKLILTVTLIVLLGQLVMLKYAGFVSREFATFLPQSVVGVLVSPKLQAPLGISFYTFVCIGYLIDVYRRRVTSQPILSSSILALFFPTVTAGPIERADHFTAQLRQRHALTYDNLSAGLLLCLLGLYKKLVIADNLAIVVDSTFVDLANFRGLSLVITIFFYGWQLYFDFSGYTDIARGIARVFGFSLLPNFRTPYASTSLTDFWRRWHISLSSWFRDYIYIPLGGNRQGALRRTRNTVIVFALCGLWHGAGWTFLAWGLWHAAGLLGERFLRDLMGRKLSLPSAITTVLTFAFVTIGWVFFRSTTLSDALTVFRSMPIGLVHSIEPSYVLATLLQLFDENMLELAITLGMLATGITMEWMAAHSPLGTIYARLPVFARICLVSGMALAVILLRSTSIREFVYVQF